MYIDDAKRCIELYSSFMHESFSVADISEIIGIIRRSELTVEVREILLRIPLVLLDLVELRMPEDDFINNNREYFSNCCIQLPKWKTCFARGTFNLAEIKNLLIDIMYNCFDNYALRIIEVVIREDVRERGWYSMSIHCQEFANLMRYALEMANIDFCISA